MRHVITLSSIPPRFSSLGPSLKSLLAQTSRPEAVELYIPRSYRRFPQWSGGLPEVPEGVRIVRVEEDLGPATKVLPAAKAYRGQDIEILYVDDDRHYDRNIAAAFLKCRRHHPGEALCTEAMSISELGYDWVASGPLPRAFRDIRPFSVFRRSVLRAVDRTFPRYFGQVRLKAFQTRFSASGYGDVAEGFGGVLVRPEFFDDAVSDIPPILWAVDDVWISGHLTRRGIPIWVEMAGARISNIGDMNETFALYRAELDGARRDDANRACVDYMRETYGIWGGKAAQST